MNKDVVARRRDKAIAVILGTKEREIDGFLPPQVAIQFRKLILDQINDLVDTCMDMNDSVVWNELFEKKLSEIHEVLVGRGDDG
jgi:hypothetical protein